MNTSGDNLFLFCLIRDVSSLSSETPIVFIFISSKIIKLLGTQYEINKYLMNGDISTLDPFFNNHPSI